MKQRMKIFIVGAGEVGSHLAKMFRAESNEVTVIDDDAKRLSELSSYADVDTALGSPTSISILKEAGVAKADLFIAVYPFSTQEVNIVSSILAKNLGASKVLARVNNEEYLLPDNRLLFNEMGIESVFYPESIASDEIVKGITHGSSFEIMPFTHSSLQVSVFRMREETPVLDMKLKDFISSASAEDLSRYRILAINHNGKTVIPTMDSKFQYGDEVYASSNNEGLASLCAHFGMSQTSIHNVMIVGGGPMAEMVARKLALKGYSVKIIDKDKNRCLVLSEKLPDNVMVINADGRNSDSLFEEGIKDYDAFLALTGDDENNILACVVAKKLGVPRTVAGVETIEYIRLAEEMGVDSIINKKLITAGKIFKYTLSGKARFVKYLTGTDAEIIEYTVAPGSAITKSPLKDLGFPKHALIAGITRGEEGLVAVGDTWIEAYDRVAVFALSKGIDEIDKFFK